MKMAEVVLGAVSIVSGCLVAPVNRLCGYAISYDSHVCKLEDKVVELDQAREGVQDSIDDANRNMKPIKRYVNQWVEDVEKHAEEARCVLDDKAKITCFRGWLPNLKVRYRLGREASRKAERIQGLINRTPPEKVYDDPPPGLVDGASDLISSASDRGDTNFDSRASILEDIMNALDDEKHKVIGIYGPGGVGKTTILEKVEQKLRKEGRPFHMIVKSKVSQTPDLKKIQDDIAYAFGLNLRDSEEGRKDLLFKRFQMNSSEKVLIILDDLWAELDLKAIGNPLGNESMKCKLLLTSRDKRVLEQRMHADQIFRLNGLEEDEAFKLFEKGVGDKLRDDEELKVKAAQVVTKLAGLPLLINSVASTLKYSDVSTWEDMLVKIEDPNNERIVKWSYDHLESEEAKCLFLLCGLIGGTIRVELLLGLGMGLGLFGGFDNKMQTSRNRLNTMLNSLHSFCLLQDGGDGKENVTIHDLYSEVVVSNAFSGQNSLMINNNYGSWPKEKLEKCWACLVNVGSDRLAELMLRQFPHVKILTLSEQNDMGDCSRMDFTYMEELQALYLCSMRVTSLPSSMEILGNLQSLSIDCHVEDVANLGKLKALRILSFARSKISRLPKEIGKLTNLRSLNLSLCYLLEIIEPGALKGLINLEELHMKKSFDRWMGKNEKPSELCNAGIAELRSMTKLNSLEISIRDPIILLEVDDLPFENLTRFWINIGNAEGREFKDLRTMKIKSKGHDGILSKKWVHKTLQKTQYLLLDGLGEFEIAHKLCIRGFPQLKHLDIQNSPSVKYIASSSNSAFTVLESLCLNNLINLEKICHGHIATECLSKLKAVRVKVCNRLKYFWCLSQMQNFVQLEEIVVWRCDSVRAIARKDIVPIVPADYKVELPYLRLLVLANLPNMMSFCARVEMTSEGAPIQVGIVGERGGNEGTKLLTTTSDLQDTSSDSFFDREVTLPNIISLKIIGIPCKELWNNHVPTDSFQKLKSINLTNCNNLQHIATPSMWKKLQHGLEKLEVYSCRSIEIIYTGDGTDIECGELWKLVLHDLGNLRCIWQSDGLPNVPFPKLRQVEAVRCSHLEMLFPSFTAKFLGQIKELIVESCENMELIAGQEIGEEAIRTRITFSKLSALRLFELPKFKGILPERYSLKLPQSEDFPSLLFLSILNCGVEKNRGHGGSWTSYGIGKRVGLCQIEGS